MAEAFSIFPDTHDSRRLGSKGGLLTSKKKALQDVKNTLSSKQVAGKAFMGKFNPGGKAPLRPSAKDMCETVTSKATLRPPAKDLCETATPKSAFKIKCDEDLEDFSSWDPCDCNKNFEDMFPVIRTSSECFDDEDIAYMMSGILRNLESPEVVLPPDDCLGLLEVDVFPDIPQLYLIEDLGPFDVIPVDESDDDM